MSYGTRAISRDAIQNGEFQSLTPIAEKHLTNQGVQRASEGGDLRAMMESPLMRHRLIQSQRRVGFSPCVLATPILDNSKALKVEIRVTQPGLEASNQ
ncbi:hypothetical protein U1Q18_011484 [Sarracenia purpurea var. burkii]